MGLSQAPKFVFKCTFCNYKATLKGLWAVITHYPDRNFVDDKQSTYSFLCVTCDENKVAEKEEVSA